MKKLSKFLSFVLRHSPETLNLKIDKQGWADLDGLILAINLNQNKNTASEKFKPQPVTREMIVTMVEENDKQRFSISPDGKRIRSNQGHSIKIDLDLEPQIPPEYLFHGTVYKFIESIKTEGLRKMERHHVHLSQDIETAQKVGQRRGKAIILKINAIEMHKDGHLFFLTENGVWLTEKVLPGYLIFP